MCTFVGFASLWYFLLLWFTTRIYIAICLSVRDKIDRTAATWMSGCFLRKETLQTHERYWQKLAFCLFMFIKQNCMHLTIMNFCNSQTKLAGRSFEVFLRQVNSHWKVWWIYQGQHLTVQFECAIFGTCLFLVLVVQMQKSLKVVTTNFRKRICVILGHLLLQACPLQWNIN